MPVILRHQMGTYISREDIREAKNSKYTFEADEAMVFATRDEAEQWDRMNMAHKGILEIVEVEIKRPEFPRE